MDINTRKQPKVKKREKTKLQNKGTYGCSPILYEVYLTLRGYDQSNSKINITTSLVDNACKQGDEDLALRSISWMFKEYGNGSGTLVDFITMGKLKKVRDQDNLHPRYHSETQELENWKNASYDDIFAHDLVYKYRELYGIESNKVGYEVTSKVSKIGSHTEMALKYKSRHILLYQLLYQNLSITKSLMLKCIEGNIDNSKIVEMFLNSKQFDDDFLNSFMGNVAKAGHIRTLRMMIAHKTIPDNYIGSSIVVELIVRCNNPNKLEDGEVPDESDFSRLVWHEFSLLCGEILGDAVKQWIRASYLKEKIPTSAT